MDINELKLVHYAGSPFDFADFKDAINLSDTEDNFHKPLGFWFSVDNANDSWLKYCAKTKWRPELLEYVHDVKLAKDANIIFLKNPDDFFMFTEKFNTAQEIWRSINWNLVKQEYDGIIISPYQSGLRREPNVGWYYTWNCASGCIWRKRAIESVTLRRKY